MSTRRYAVIGTGAIGGLYGARLAAAGHEVHFLARSDADHMKAHGLVVESVYGDVKLDAPHVWTDPAAVPEVDVVLVAIKTTANEHVGELLTPLVGQGTVVVMLQNGLGIEEAAAEVVPEAQLLAGLCFTCSNRVGPGHIQHIDYGSITLAAHRSDGASAGVTSEMEAVAADLRTAGVEIDLVEDLQVARWRKLAWNMPFNGLSVVLDAETDEMLANPHIEALAAAMIDEVCEAAAACGAAQPPGLREGMIAMTRTMRPYATSMKLDAQAGRPMELDAIYGAPLAAGKAAGVAMPRLDALHAQLRFIDARNRR